MLIDPVAYSDRKIPVTLWSFAGFYLVWVLGWGVFFFEGCFFFGFLVLGYFLFFYLSFFFIWPRRFFFVTNPQAAVGIIHEIMLISELLSACKVLKLC